MAVPHRLSWIGEEFVLNVDPRDPSRSISSVYSPSADARGVAGADGPSSFELLLHTNMMVSQLFDLIASNCGVTASNLQLQNSGTGEYISKSKTSSTIGSIGLSSSTR